MNLRRVLNALLMIVSIAVPAASIGCAAGGGGYYRVRDPYYRDYHVWNDDERGYYNRWARENHRENREFRQLNRREQQEYWQWRHQNERRQDGPRDRDRR